MGYWDNLSWNPKTWIGASAEPKVIPGALSLAQLDELVFNLNATGSAKSYLKYGLVTTRQVRTAFRKCSVLEAIVSQKAFAFTKGAVTVWNPESEKPVRGQFKEWERLFRNPNPYQSQRQFFIEAYSYQQRFGYCVIRKVYPSGYTDRPKELHILPNWLIEWDTFGSGYRQRPKRCWVNTPTGREEIPMEELIIIVDPASTEYDESTWLPLSRAACLEAEVSNLIAGLEGRGEIITDRGAMGVLSNASKDAAGSAPMLQDDKDRIQADLRQYGIMKGKKKIIFSPTGMSWTPMTFDVAQMGLHPEHIANIKAICNRYGFPFTMLAEGYEGKYNNSGNSRRDFQDTTIDPESMDFFEQLSRGLGMYEQKCEAYMDYSGVASVQMSQREKGLGEQAMAQAVTTEWDLGIITRNEARERLGMDKVEGNEGEFDKYKFETDSAIAAQEQIQQQGNETQAGQAQAPNN